MATKGYAKALATEQPSVMKRILSFFKEASNYKNERLSRAAKSYYKLYQKMYEEFSAANRGNNALGGVEGSKRYSQETIQVEQLKEPSIKEQLKESLDVLNKMEVVASITEDVSVVEKNKQSTIEWVLNKIDTVDGKTNREGFGDIVVDKKRISSALRYFKTSEERLALAAVTQVLKYGVEIGNHNKHKQRSYDTITFAAPIEINGTRGNMAVIVRQEGDNYYKVHRLMLPDGSSFVFDKKRDIAERAGGVENNSGLSPTDNISTNSIPQTPEKSTPSTKKDGEANLPEGARAALDIGSSKRLDKLAKKSDNKRKDSLINKTFPPYRESQSDANERAVRWAHQEDVEAGDQRIAFYHNRIYLIQKTDDIHGERYIVLRRVLVKEYNEFKKDIEKGIAYGRIKSIDNGYDIVYASNQRADTNRGGRPSVDSNVLAQQGREDTGIRQVGTIKESRSEQIEHNSGENSERRSENRQGRGTVGLTEENPNNDNNGIRYSLDISSIREQTEGKVHAAAPESYKPSKRESISSGFTGLQIALTNAQAGIEKIGKKFGVKDIEARVQSARAAMNQAQEMIGGEQWGIGADGKGAGNNKKVTERDCVPLLFY